MLLLLFALRPHRAETTGPFWSEKGSKRKIFICFVTLSFALVNLITILDQRQRDYLDAACVK